MDYVYTTTTDSIATVEFASEQANALSMELLQHLTKELDILSADKEIKVDVRVLAATNKDLKKEIEAGKFREDLYHRLSVIEIHVPSLDERKDDIPILVKHFAKLISEEQGTSVKEFDDKAIKTLQNFSWTGNIRELRNVVERLIILGSNPVTAEDVTNFVRK